MKCTGQLVIFLTVYVSLLTANTSTKRRIYSLEQRVNSMEIRVTTDSAFANERFHNLEGNVDELNTSLINIREMVSDVQDMISSFGLQTEKSTNEIFILNGLANEKKWLRDTFKSLEEQHENKLNVKIADIDYLFHAHKEEVNKKLKEIGEISENKTILLAALTASKVEDIANLNLATFDQLWDLSKQKDLEIEEQNLLIETLEQTSNKLKSTVIRMSSEMGFSICESGWTQNGLFCYLYIEESGTYYSAREKCNMEGGHVADIQSSAENEFILKLWEGNRRYSSFYADALWVGITDEVEENVWLSDRTGTKVIYTNWRRYQPNGSTRESCVVMGLGYSRPRDQWNDIMCTNMHSFVCKK